VTNYTKFIYEMKRKVTNFSKIITKQLSKPKSKFIAQMIYGLLQSQSVLLSEISRAQKENILLKKSIERLSRNLENFDEQEKLIDEYIKKLSLILMTIPFFVAINQI